MSDITTLFLTDPMNLSDQDLDVIIADLREKRHLFNENEKKPKAKAAPKLSAKQQAAAKLNIGIEL